MIKFFRFSPFRLALGYIALSVLALALFAIPLWYAWTVNISTFRAYVQGEDMQRLVDVFHREGAQAVASAMEARTASMPRDEVVVFADPSKLRLAGNLSAWPAEVPDAPGTYGLVIDLGGGSSMRVVASHVRLPGGYHLLMGRESVRFQSLVDLFWYGIAGATGIVLLLGVVVGWIIRRALLSEVHEISRTASAIVEGDLSRRLATRSGSDELDTLARTVNGMLEQLANQNVRLEDEISVRRQAEQELHRAHDNLEGVVARRTEQLARANESMEGEKRLLEMIAKGNPLPATLDALCRFVEETSSGVLCSILLLDSKDGRLGHGAAPSLPQSYIAAIDGWPLTAGPCGLAASLGQPVIASDIASDERWHEYKALASAYGLKACWSTPIISSDGKVLGTFAMLSREPGSPTPKHQDTIEQVTHIASIAIERTRAEEGLQRQTAYLDELFELAPDAIVLTDLSHPRILRINKEFTRVFGYTPEEAVNQRLRHLIVPDDVPPAGLTENADLLSGRTVEKEVVRRRKDGTRFHAHVTAKRVRLQGDEDAAYLIYRDITERKLAEEQLQRQKTHLDELFDLAPDAIVLTTLEPRTLRVNQEFTKMFGYTPDEVIGRRLRNFIAPGELSPEALTDVPALIAGQKVEREALRQRKDGTRFHAHITAARVPLQDEQGAYLIYRDITERKQAEVELRARQEMLDLAQKAARTVAFEWRFACSGEPNRWSPELEAMYGLVPGTYDGTFETWKKLVHPEDWPSVEAAIKVAHQSGDIAAEYRIVHADGAVRWLQAKGRILSGAGGQPERMVGFMLDVTERRQAEEELRRLEQQLRRAQRLEAMGTLAGGIAHDFNNILGAILGYGEMALRDAPRESRLRRDLESITTAGERGRALVDRILAFSRSGLGERVAVDVEKVVRESLDLLMANLPPGITVKAELRAGRAAMRGDPTQVHQVVMNLATNGIQAMDPGGILRVSLGMVRLDAQRIATTGTVAAGNYILLKVADAGRGIPAGILDRIFDPFFTTKEVGVGTGLGLSLVHGIVTEVGGAIDVETTLGAGSVFTVYLPHAGDVADGSADEQPAMPRGDQQRVLIVDDEEPLVRLTTETLQELGYVRFDAVITDERMPGMSGSALIREVRGIRRSIPILLVSGYVGGMVTNRAYNAGADEVLKKRLSARELAVSLARVLQSQ